MIKIKTKLTIEEQWKTQPFKSEEGRGRGREGGQGRPIASMRRNTKVNEKQKRRWPFSLPGLAYKKGSRIQRGRERPRNYPAVVGAETRKRSRQQEHEKYWPLLLLVYSKGRLPS